MYTGIRRRSLDMETGAFEFGPIPPGMYDLSVRRAKTRGVLWARSDIALRDGVEVDFGNLVIGDLEGAGHLEVLIQDEAGNRLDQSALGTSALRVRMSDRMMSVLPQDGGDRWRPEFALAAGDWFAEMASRSYRASKVQFTIREGETTQVVMTATLR